MCVSMLARGRLILATDPVAALTRVHANIIIIINFFFVANLKSFFVVFLILKLTLI